MADVSADTTAALPMGSTGDGWQRTLSKLFDANTLKLLVALLIPVAYWLFLRHRRMTLLSRYGIPVPPGSFWTGHFAQLVSQGVPVKKQWFKEYGRVFGYNFGIPSISIADADLARKIQVKVS